MVLLAVLAGGCGGRTGTDLFGGAGGQAGSTSIGAGSQGTGGAPPGSTTTGATSGTTTTGTGTGGSGPLKPSGWHPGPCDINERAFAPARIWQITDQEYVNAVRDVLGIALAGQDALIASATNGTGEFTNLSENPNTFTDMVALNYQVAAQKVAAQASLAAKMTALVGSTTPTHDQLTTFINTKIARLLRRPVSAEELASLLKIYDDATANPADGGPSWGFSLMLQAPLQWPSFLFRTELGNGTMPATAEFQLTPYELATAISMALTDSVPDDELWARAANGTLSSPDISATQVDRLMSMPAAQTNLAKYLSYWLWIERVPARAKDTTLYPEFTPNLQQALYESGFAFLKDLLLHGTLSDLFTSTKVYVNQEMSAVYGMPGGTGSTPTSLQPVTTTLPERASGLLTQPAFLAATNRRPGLLDPVHHGLFVLEALLDGADVSNIPPPPADSLGKAVLMHGNERELAAQRATTQGCGQCHATFDCFGLTRYRYDSIGRYNDTRYVNADTTVMPAKYEWITSPVPLDTSAVIPDIDGPDLKGPLADTAALAHLLASDGPRRRVAYAAGRILSLYVMGHDATLENSCALQNVKEQFYQSGSFTGFFRALLTSPAFATRDPGR